MSAGRAQGRVGRVLRDKWHLDRLLGAGGMACVYAATHRNGTRAAVKLLHPELSENPDIRQRFLREGYVSNSIEHQGVVRVFDDDTDTDGSVYLVMDLLVGETLDARWKRSGKRLELEEVLRIGVSVLDILVAAHAKGIVHRDIKPENIFLTQAGELKVLDFGIARVREAQQENTTQTGALLGTPSYMAPEQARGNWAEVDGRTDLWAAGATLFAMLAGRPPHAGSGGNEVLLAAMTKPAPRLAEIAPAVPKHSCDVIDRALAFDRTQRWPDARAMQQALLSSTAALGFAPSIIGPVDTSQHLPPHPTQPQAHAHLTEAGVAKTLNAARAPQRWILPVLIGSSLVVGGAVAFGVAAFRGVFRHPQPPTQESVVPSPIPIAASASIEPLATAPILASTPSAIPSAPPIAKGSPSVVHRPAASAVSSSSRPAPSASGATDIHDSRR